MRTTPNFETKIVNKKAYFEYHILQDYVAGVVLLGSEVKSIRDGNSNLVDAFCYIRDGEVFIKNLHVSKNKGSSYMNHEEMRDRKLLLKKREINNMVKIMRDKGTTIVPLEIFISGGRIKMKVGVVKGKKLWDKKETIKERDVMRELRSV